MPGQITTDQTGWTEQPEALGSRAHQPVPVPLSTEQTDSSADQSVTARVTEDSDTN